MPKWIVCCGMIRSGSTLQYQIVKELIEANNLGKAIGYFEGKEFLNLIISKKVDKGLYVVKNHLAFEIPKFLNENDFIFIYSFRDIRDVIVSLMYKNNCDFFAVFTPNFSQKQLNNYYQLLNMRNIYTSRYENLLQNLYLEIQTISNFLNIQSDDSLTQSIFEKYSISNQKVRIESSDFEKEGISKYGYLHLKDSLLHKTHIHSGEIDQWKKTLSSLQIGLVQRDWKQWILLNNYEYYDTIYNVHIILPTGLFFTKLIKKVFRSKIFRMFRKLRNRIRKLLNSR